MTVAVTPCFVRADDLIGLVKGEHRSAIEATRRGIPVASIESLIEAGRLSRTEVDLVILPRKTLSHRKKIGTLTPEQSDRLIRVVRVISAAEETFGSEGKAARWLRRPTEALAGDAPLALLDTTEGIREVESLLGRIDHGLGA